VINLLFIAAEDSTNEQMATGPFREVYIEGGELFADGKVIAYIFAESASDMINPANLFGHPDAGKWVISDTERLYGRCVITINELGDADATHG